MLLFIIITLITELNAKVNFGSILSEVGKQISSETINHILKNVDTTSENNINDMLVFANTVLKDTHNAFTAISYKVNILLSVTFCTVFMIGLYFLILIVGMFRDYPIKHKDP